jgi:hypothetical protein
MVVTVALFAGAGVLHGATIRVPMDQPTIKQGISAAAPGDTVLLAPGMYSGSLNKNIGLQGKDIVLASETGPLDTVIDCEYDGRGFNIRDGETGAAVIQGITVFRAHTWGRGAGAYLADSSPTFVRCVFRQVHLDGETCWPDVNPAFGAAVYAEHSDFLLQNCSILGSTIDGEPVGGTAIAMYDARATLRNCLVAYNTGGLLYRCETDPCVFDDDHCIYSGNTTADRDNITVPDPGFCDWPLSIELCEDSPALLGNNPWAEVVGAIDTAGCGPCLTAIEQTSWGTVKALYRH